MTKNLDNAVQGISLLIDCDASPFVPDGWKIEEHRKCGQFKFDPAKVGFYCSPEQKGENLIEGNDLRKELAGKPVMNACVLDHLLVNTNLIPENWKSIWVYFWGTVYCDPEGDLCVRRLCWYDGWIWDASAIDVLWAEMMQAAVFEG